MNVNGIIIFRTFLIDSCTKKQVGARSASQTPGPLTIMRSSTFLRILAATTFAVACAACGPSYQVARPDSSTGMLPTSVEVKPDEIKVFSPMPGINNIKFVLLRTSSNGNHTDPYGEFMKSSIAELGFPKIMTRDELVKIVLSSDLRDSVGNVTDPIALAKINDAIGPFIIVDAVQDFLGRAWFETRVRIVDPANADVLLEIHRVRNNWASLDREVNYPVLNVLKRWLEDSRSLLPAQAPEKSAAPPVT